MSKQFLPGWTPSTLADTISNIEAGTSVNSEDRPKEDGEFGILKTSAASGGRFLPHEYKTVRNDEVDRLACPVRKNTIIVSRMNTKALVGESGFVREDHDDLFLPDRLWALTPSPNVSPNWLGHLIASPRLRAEIGIRATGTSATMKNISQDALLGISIELPPLPEQRRIAAILDEWDNAIATAEKLVRAKKKRQSAVLSAVFANAPKLPLYEIADVIMGQSPPSSAYREPGTGQLPLVQGAADFSGGLVIAKSDTDIVTKSVEQPCIVMSVRAPVGTFARLAFPACLGRGVCGLVPKDGLALDYVASVITGLSPYWATMAQGSSFEAVSGDIIRDALVPFGTADFLRSSARVFQMVSKELNQEVGRTQALRLQKRGMMQKLLRGDWPAPASIDRLLPGGQEVDEAVGAEVQHAEATG